MSKLKVGDAAPLFRGLNQNEKEIKLADYRGKKLVLFFYPKDDTPTCTKEACNLSENYDRFKKNGYEVVGVSPDTAKKHTKFIEKYQLNYDLLADTEKEAIQAYGLWVEKSMYGRQYMGVARTTFIIDEEGIITDIIDKVKAKEHADQIL
jgi:peroxiredoxin Q/BCP